MPASKHPNKGNDPGAVRARQDDFLKAYGACGTIRSASLAVGVHRATVNEWKKDPIFRDRFSEAKLDFAEHLEEIAFARLKEQTAKDNPILLITLLNAHYPERNRPKEAPANEEGKQFMLEMRRMWASLPENNEDETMVNPTVDDEIKRLLDKKRGRS